MQPSIFNLRVPLPSRDQVFLMNTLTDAQLLVSPDVAALLDRTAGGARVDDFDAEAREALSLLSDQGFLVDDRHADRRALEKNGWNVTSTAEYLGVPLSTLKYKMDKLEVRQLAKRLRGA